MLMKAAQSTLLLIDVQEKLMPAIFDGESIIARCSMLATIASMLQVPVIGTEQMPGKLGHNIKAIREFCRTTLAKEYFDACPEGLIEELPEGRQ
ncbi:MAG: isochorismatase, partial [Marinospirillum sp.]|nr:isochorismatase [Marinospirillum sp.]